MLDERWLPLIMEECGEVLQVIGKIQRFGQDHEWPGRGRTNAEELALEIGDLLEVIDRANVDFGLVIEGRMKKRKRLEEFGPDVWRKIGDG